MVSNLSLQLSEGKRIFLHSRKVSSEGYQHYDGDAFAICEKIIEDCWDGTYFHASCGHFSEFYCRDIGWCAPYLIHLGYKEELKSTVAFALKRFAEHGKICVAIDPSGVPFDFPNFPSVDSLAYLLRTLRLCDARDLVEQHRSFLNSQVSAFAKISIDASTGLLKKDVRFSAMKDHALRKSSMYDNTMLGVLSAELSALGLENPFSQYDYPQLLKDYLWSGNYFFDDLQKIQIVTGDSNVIPFWTGLISDEGMLKAAVKSMQDAGLDDPFPLSYVASPDPRLKMISAEFFVPGWEQDCIWPMMGMMYIDILSRVDRKKALEHLENYRKVIEKNANFIELFKRDGRPYRSFFYAADEGMLWACMFLSLSRRV